jgi:Leucine-rich repeat (LRR) protein
MANEIGPILGNIIDGFPRTQATEFYVPKNIFDLESISINASPKCAERLGLAKSAAKEAIKQWEAVIPKLKGLRKLTIHQKTNQSLFEAISTLESLKELSFESLKLSDLRPILRLVNLKKLSLKNCSQIKDISPVGELTNLDALEIENMPIKAINSLENMQQLRDLRLAGGIWKTMKIESLHPIQSLKNIKRLALPNLRTKDKDIRILSHLVNLEELQLAMWWNKEDYQYLEANLPKLKTVSWKKIE